MSVFYEQINDENDDDDFIRKLNMQSQLVLVNYDLLLAVFFFNYSTFLCHSFIVQSVVCVCCHCHYT